MPKPPKKPNLAIVDSSPLNPLAPPATLGAAGAKLWSSIQADFRIDDAGGREMLQQICGAADTVADCDAIIAADGRLIRTKNGVLKEHPLLKAQLAARSFIVRSLHRLGLDIEVTRNEDAGVRRTRL